MHISQKLREFNVVIVTHVFVTGPAQELEEYLKEKVNCLVFIGHPFSYAEDIRSFYRIYHKGVLLTERRTFCYRFPDILMYFKDVFYTIYWIVRLRKVFNLFVGADPLNALAGIILKKLGKIKKVIFYSIDYTPYRFNNKFLNWIYHKVDSFCSCKCDFVWNLSQRMIDARRRKGIKRVDNQMVVPMGVHFERIIQRDVNQINRNHIVYMGHLRKGQGLELVIESLPQIIERIKSIRLIVIGTGILESILRNMVKKLKVEDYVEFKGYIKDHKEIEEILVSCAVGLAVYEPILRGFTWYTDSGKPKQYLACGLPVVITEVPSIAEEIRKREMGVIIEYNKNDLTSAITKLLSDDNFYNKCRKNAIKFASDFSWDRVFGESLEKVCRE